MASPFVDRYVTVDGFRIRYWDEGSGTPVLLVHGIGNSIEVWEFNIAALAEVHRVVALDIPGAGRSSRTTRPDIYSLEYAGRFLKDFLNILGIQRLSVAGHSMGGMLATQLTLLFPELVDKLILVDSAGFGSEIGGGLPILTIWPLGELLLHPTKPAVERIAKDMLYRHEVITDDFVETMLTLSKIPGTKEAILKTLRSGVNLHGQFALFSKEELSKIVQPVMIVWGKDDTLFPTKHGEAALKQISNCRAVLLDKARHASQIDRPEAFNQLTLEFLEKGRLSAENGRSKRSFIVL